MQLGLSVVLLCRFEAVAGLFKGSIFLRYFRVVAVISLFLTGFAYSAGADPLFAGEPPLSGGSGPGSLGLAWNPSPDPAVTGYFLCWGVAPGQCTNRMDVGNTTNTFVSGLQEATRYFFTVVAYDETREAPPSNEVSYLVPSTDTPPPLRTQVVRPAGQSPALRLSFQAVAGTTYTVQATRDFDVWESVLVTNSPADGLITFDAAMIAPRRFYRLEQN